jgi:hypothetical protein
MSLSSDYILKMLEKYAEDYPNKEKLTTDESKLYVLSQTIDGLLLSLKDWQNFGDIVKKEYNIRHDKLFNMWIQATELTNKEKDKYESSNV